MVRGGREIISDFFEKKSIKTLNFSKVLLYITITIKTLNIMLEFLLVSGIVAVCSTLLYGGLKLDDYLTEKFKHKK